MSAVLRQPANMNFLNPNGFKLLIKRLPNLEYFCQVAELPDVQIGEQVQPNPFQPIFHPSTRMDFNPITVDFIVDEELSTYQEIFDWMNSLTSTETYEQYEDLVADSDGGNVLSDMSLYVLTSKKNPKNYFYFRDAFPVHLSGMKYNIKDTEFNYLTASVTFRYTSFKIRSVTSE